MKRNFLEVELIGGLGNQLFTYFAGMYKANQLHRDLILDLALTSMSVTSHQSSITSFMLPGHFYESSRKGKSARFFTRASDYISRRFGIYSKLRSYLDPIYTSPVIGFDENLENITRISRIRGHYQTYKYVDALKKDGNFVTGLELRNPSAWYLTLEQKMKSENPIAVHIRRGDYVEKKNHFIGMLSSNYYREAIMKLNYGHSPRVIWVFTDDVVLARESSSGIFDDGVFWVEPPINSDPAESMLLMSHASSIVISNSTFSWWSASMSKKGAEIVAPSSWFRGREDPLDLIPATWMRAKSEWLN
jgi:hypothetical protein